MYFNPRSHEGSDVTSPSAQLFLLYFNPRSHEGSDDSLYGIFQSRPQFQSTLPRRERHFGHIRNSRNLHISIHAPTKGATPNASAICRISFSISIHAPTKGATFRAWKFFQDHEYFNPRSHEGSDILGTSEIVEIYIFQSTLPRRERRHCWVDVTCK